MSAPLSVRKAVKDVLAPLGVPVLYADATMPTTGEYFVLTVISAPVTDDWGGVAYQGVRVQCDLWTYSVSDTRAGTLGEQAMRLFDGKPWRVIVSGQPLSFEGERDSTGKRWFRSSFDVTREA